MKTLLRSLLCPAFVWAGSAMGQNQPLTNTHKYVGLTVEQSLKSGYKLDQDYDYHATLIELNYEKPISSIVKKNIAVNFLVQPQFNWATYRDWKVEQYQNTWEAGINAGVVFHAYLDESSTRTYITISGSSGPHFIDDTPVRQASGFIFCNNIRFGFHYPIFKNFNAEVRMGLRHLSNAGLVMPNYGIDNVFVGVKLDILVNPESE